MTKEQKAALTTVLGLIEDDEEKSVVRSFFSQKRTPSQRLRWEIWKSWKEVYHNPMEQAAEKTTPFEDYYAEYMTHLINSVRLEREGR